MEESFALCFALCWLWLLITNTSRFANHTVVPCHSSLQSYLSVCSMPQASLLASLSLMYFHYAQLLLPCRTQCSYAAPAMYCSPVPFHPPSEAQDRSSGGTGSPCLICAPQNFSWNAFWLPVETLSRSFDGGKKLSLLNSIITFVSLMARKYESIAFLFFM